MHYCPDIQKLTGFSTFPTKTFTTIKNGFGVGMVAHAYNPSYSKGGYWEKITVPGLPGEKVIKTPPLMSINKSGVVVCTCNPSWWISVAVGYTESKILSANN
jgi:hypothetical protein